MHENDPGLSQFFVGFGLAAWLLLDYTSRVGESGGALLLIYWALNLPALGQDVAQIAWRYPTLRNTTLRSLEPLGAPEEKETGIRHGLCPSRRLCERLLQMGCQFISTMSASAFLVT